VSSNGRQSNGRAKREEDKGERRTGKASGPARKEASIGERMNVYGGIFTG
jgi:hypothetical protein